MGRSVAMKWREEKRGGSGEEVVYHVMIFEAIVFPFIDFIIRSNSIELRAPKNIVR